MGKPPKLGRPWDGPFTILRRINDVTYELKLPAKWRMHPVIWVGYLKRYKGQGIAPPNPDYDDDGNPLYEVEDIIKDRYFYGTREYLVQWKGYSEDERTWEREDELQRHAKDALAEYLAEHPAVRPRKGTRQSSRLAHLHCHYCEISEDNPGEAD